MNVVMCNIDPALRNLILSQLVYFKLDITLLEATSDLVGSLQEKQADCLFYDIDLYEADMISLLSDIKTRPGLEELKIIVLTANKDKKLRNDLFSMELAGIISKDTNYHDFIANLKKAILYLEMEVKQRVNRWVPPPGEDEVKVSFRLNPKQRLALKVTEMSVDGLRVKLTGNKAHFFLKSGSGYNNVILSINKKIFYINVKAARIRDEICTLLFTSKKDVFLLEISSYIHKLLLTGDE